jgi:hypothetical protein
LWFGGVWLMAAIAAMVSFGFFFDEDARSNGSVLSPLGLAAGVLMAAPFVLPFAIFTFFWFSLYRRPAAAS